MSEAFFSPNSVYVDGQWHGATWLAEVTDPGTGELVITATVVGEAGAAPSVTALRMDMELARRLRASVMGEEGKEYYCRTTGERLAVQEDRLQILSDTTRRIVAGIVQRLDALDVQIATVDRATGHADSQAEAQSDALEQRLAALEGVSGELAFTVNDLMHRMIEREAAAAEAPPLSMHEKQRLDDITVKLRETAHQADALERRLVDVETRVEGLTTPLGAWEDMQRAALAEATGVPALRASTSSHEYEAFYGENRTLAEQHGLHQAPICERMRVRSSPYGGGLMAEGAQNAELVCLHSGRSCECLARIKKDVSKDGRAQWKLVRQQTVEALTAALLNPTQDTMRLWASYHAPYDKTDEVVSWRMKDVVKTIVKALLDRAKPYDAEQKPEESRKAMEKLLARGNIAAPWSLVALLAPEPDPMQRIRGRVKMLVTWITSATSETPLAADLERWIDDSRAAMEEIAGLPAGFERDELAALADAANQSSLEMLDLVAGGRYEVSKEVAWICHTPVSDVNARTSLERATVDDLRWCLAVARCQGEAKERIRTLQRLLRRVGKGLDGLDGSDSADGAGRPFPSTASVQAAKREKLHRLVVDGPPAPNGYIAPTVDPNAPDVIDGKLQRIAGWIADFADPGDGLPTPESVAGNFDNLDKLAQRIAGQASEGDRMKLQAMHTQIYADLATGCRRAMTRR